MLLITIIVCRSSKHIHGSDSLNDLTPQQCNMGAATRRNILAIIMDSSPQCSILCKHSKPLHVWRVRKHVR